MVEDIFFLDSQELPRVGQPAFCRFLIFLCSNVLIQTSREIHLSSMNLPPKFVSTHYNHEENTGIHSYAII